MESAVHALLALVTDFPSAKTALAASACAAVLVGLLSTWAAQEGIVLGAVLVLRHCANGCPAMQDAVRGNPTPS